MSNRINLRRAGIALAAGFMFTALPAVAQAAPVNLATAGPFVVLGGATVTNTGPSVLNGDLGVSPGSAIVGFGSPAVVNGATHANDAVAGQAQADLSTAYAAAAGQPVAPGDILTGTDLGNRTLGAGAYRYDTSAQLTGKLTLDGAGDPNAQFVFEIGSTLTTASASSVELVNGASPCNVYWQVGSSATLGSTTAFQGTVMALASITANTGATVTGRLLARNGSVTLDTNTLDNTRCAALTTTPTGTTTSTSGTPAPTTPAVVSPTPARTTPGGSPSRRDAPGSDAYLDVPHGWKKIPGSRGSGTAIMIRGPRVSCKAGFHAKVRGKRIKRVEFGLDGRRVGSPSGSPFELFVRAAPGKHTITARVTFRGSKNVRTFKVNYRACAAVVLRPRRGPSPFTG